MLKKLPFSKSLSQLRIFLVKKKKQKNKTKQTNKQQQQQQQQQQQNRRNTATTVQSDVTVALTDSGKQTTYCLNTLTNIACLAAQTGKG